MPAPQDDDVSYLSFGAVAEAVLARTFLEASGLARAFSPSERHLLEQAHDQQRRNVDRLNAALGPEAAVPLDDFRRTVAVGSRAGALRVARRLEALVAGVYLTGVGAAHDVGTRVLLGRLVGVAADQGALLTRMAGERLGGLPTPVALDAAGAILDTYLEDPSR